MQFSKLIVLQCFCYFVSGDFLSNNQSLFNRSNLNGSKNLLEIFFINLKKVYLNKNKPRLITITGVESSKVLRSFNPLLKSYPHIVITKGYENFLYSEQLSPGNFVIVYLTDLSTETFRKNNNILSRCFNCKVLFISDNRSIEPPEILLLFTLTAEQSIGYAEFALISDKNRVDIFSRFVTKNCSMEIRSRMFWKPGFRTNDMNDWAFRDRNLNGCAVSVSISSFVPKMMIEKSKNGSLKITGGIEGELVLAIADKLNFTLVLRSPSATERIKYSRKASILNDVLSGIAEIGIGRLRPTNDIEGKVVRSVMYDTECITWGVPRIMKWSNNVVWVEFSLKVWAIIGVIFVIGCASGYTSQKIDSSTRTKRRTEIVTTVLDVISIHLGNPVTKVPVSMGGRFMLMAFLYYATVLTTAYKTSLASILTTEKGTPMVVDVNDILKLNLSIGGSRYDFDILKDQADNSEVISRLIERFVVNNNDSETLRRLKMENNFAFLARGSSLHDEKRKSVRTNGSITFDVFNTCVLSYHTVMVIRKESFLRGPINRVIRRLSEAGILEHWDIDKFDLDQIIKRRNAEKFFEERGGEKFKNIFLLYSIFMGFCVLTFLIELLIPIMIEPRKKENHVKFK